MRALTLGALCALSTGAASAQQAASPAPGSAPAPTPPASARSSGAVLPTLRFGFGADVGSARGGGLGSDLAFDAQLGLAVLPNVNGGVFFWPEVGYSSDGGDERGGRYATAGAGLLYGSGTIAAGVSSRLLLGDSRDAFAYGVRTSAVVQVFYTLFSLEAGHQWVHAGPDARHEFRVTASINPLVLVLGIAILVAPGDVLRGAGWLLLRSSR